MKERETEIGRVWRVLAREMRTTRNAGKRKGEGSISEEEYLNDIERIERMERRERSRGN